MATLKADCEMRLTRSAMICVCRWDRVRSIRLLHVARKKIPMKRLICSISLVVFVSFVAPRPALAQVEPFVGQVQTFAFNFCPVGWLPLDGRLIPITQNTALFSLLGTSYGGDGRSNFALPKWGPIFTANGATLLLCIATQGVFPSRS
jgi:Phage Tail Collar Domain